MELLFINNGYYFNIVSISVDDKHVDYKKYYNLDDIYTSREYVYYNPICKQTTAINSQSIRNYRQLKRKFHLGISALKYLKSERYSNVLYTHKYCILAQICEGFIESSHYELLLTQAKIIKIGNKKAKPNFEERIEVFINKLDEINKKYSVAIYKTLGIKRKTLLEKLTNTRHQLSHYVKKEKIIVRDDYVYVFYLLESLLRILLLEEIGIKVDGNLKKNFYVLHDFILDNKGKAKGLSDFKDLEYQLKYILKHNKVE